VHAEPTGNPALPTTHDREHEHRAERTVASAEHRGAAARACSTICSASRNAKTMHARTARPGRQPRTMTAARAMKPRPPLMPD
jgi:hypothetical protein